MGILYTDRSSLIILDFVVILSPTHILLEATRHYPILMSIVSIIAGYRDVIDAY